MITILNRKELFLTFSMEECSRIKNILCDNNIEFYIKTSTRDFWNRRRTGSFGVNMNYNYEYKFFVKGSDYEKAIYLINKPR